MNKIYTITSVSAGRPARCWGWFQTEDEAISALRADPEYFAEHSYHKYAVIEGVERGITYTQREEKWFEFAQHGDSNLCIVKQIEKPSQFEGIVCWSMG